MKEYRVTKPRDMDDLTNQLNRILGEIASHQQNQSTASQAVTKGIDTLKQQFGGIDAKIQSAVAKAFGNSNGAS